MWTIKTEIKYLQIFRECAFLSTQKLLQKKCNAHSCRDHNKREEIFCGLLTLLVNLIIPKIEKFVMLWKRWGRAQSLCWIYERETEYRTSPSPAVRNLCVINNTFDMLHPKCMSVLEGENQSKEVEVPTAWGERRGPPKETEKRPLPWAQMGLCSNKLENHWPDWAWADSQGPCKDCDLPFLFCFTYLLIAASKN